jgi:hypothetical protein
MTVKALDDRHDLLIRGGQADTEGTRDRYAYERQEVLEQCIEAWRVNPIARRLVELTSQYVVGAGIEVTSRHAQTSAFLHEWQEHRLNRLQTRAFEWCDELTRTGNLFILATTDAGGMTYLRAVPATDVEDILTKPNDVEQPVSFTMKPTLSPSPAGSSAGEGRGGGRVSYPAYDPEDDPQNDDGTFPPVLIHYAINRPVGARWGESDLAPLLLWLMRYANWLQDRARLNKYRQAFMYIVQGNYASAADRLQRQAEVNANPPGNGSILVTDSSEVWGILNPQLDSTDANTDGLALKKMIAAGAGVPLHFLAEPESSTRTTAEAAGGPTFRHYQQRQVFFLWLLRDLARLAIRRRALVDRHISVKADLEAQAPDISGRDNAALAVAATQIAAAFAQLHDRGLIPDDELVRMIYIFAGETVDVDEILSRAPRKPQTPQYGAVDPNASPSPALAGEGRGGGKPEKPADSPPPHSGAQAGQGRGNDPKPYNFNPETGDVSAKGASQ